MIVSHKYRFVFLHSRKTAGSSISVSLLRYLDRNDLFLNAPAHGIMNDALKHGIVPGPATQQEVIAAAQEQCGRELVEKVLRAPTELTKSERMAFTRAYNSLQHPHPPRPDGWQHASAARAKERLGGAVWDSYVKFSFERNPWDRMASLYWWRVRREDPPTVSFRDFVAAIHSGNPERIRANKAKHYSNWHIYTIEDRLAVDHLGRYEALGQQLKETTDKLGVPFDGWLPRSKGRPRRDVPLEQLYDDMTRELVGDVFHREIALMGYEPPF